MTDRSRSLTDLGHVTSATEFSHYFLSKLFPLYIKSSWGHHLFGICLGAPGIRFKVVKQFIFGVPQAVMTFHKLIKSIIAATYRDEQGGAGQLPCVEGAGEHQVQAGAAAVLVGLEG